MGKKKAQKIQEVIRLIRVYMGNDIGKKYTEKLEKMNNEAIARIYEICNDYSLYKEQLSEFCSYFLFKTLNEMISYISMTVDELQLFLMSLHKSFRENWSTLATLLVSAKISSFLETCASIMQSAMPKRLREDNFEVSKFLHGICYENNIVVKGMDFCEDGVLSTPSETHNLRAKRVIQLETIDGQHRDFVIDAKGLAKSLQKIAADVQHKQNDPSDIQHDVEEDKKAMEELSKKTDSDIYLNIDRKVIKSKTIFPEDKEQCSEESSTISASSIGDLKVKKNAANEASEEILNEILQNVFKAIGKGVVKPETDKGTYSKSSVLPEKEAETCDKYSDVKDKHTSLSSGATVDEKHDPKELINKDFVFENVDSVAIAKSSQIPAQTSAKQELTTKSIDTFKNHENRENLTFEKENSAPPKKETDLEEEASVTKEDEMSTPQEEELLTPKKKGASTPKKEELLTPKKKGASTPKKKGESTPKKGALTPKEEGTSTPKKDTPTPKKKKSSLKKGSLTSKEGGTFTQKRVSPKKKLLLEEPDTVLYSNIVIQPVDFLQTIMRSNLENTVLYASNDKFCNFDHNEFYNKLLKIEVNSKENIEDKIDDKLLKYWIVEEKENEKWSLSYYNNYLKFGSNSYKDTSEAVGWLHGTPDPEDGKVEETLIEFLEAFKSGVENALGKSVAQSFCDVVDNFSL